MAKTLIAYYSRRGENYVNGSIRELKLGNTEVVAAKIKALLPESDMFRINIMSLFSSTDFKGTRHPRRLGSRDRIISTRAQLNITNI